MAEYERQMYEHAATYAATWCASALAPPLPAATMSTERRPPPATLPWQSAASSLLPTTRTRPLRGASLLPRCGFRTEQDEQAEYVGGLGRVHKSRLEKAPLHPKLEAAVHRGPHTALSPTPPPPPT